MDADVAKRADEFLDDLAGQDDLGVVVRCHLRVEHELIGYIGAQLVDAKALGEALDYSQKVRLALALGLDPSLKSALNGVGSIRNRFAHKLGSHLTKADADNLYKSFTPFLKNAVQTARRKPHPKLAKSRLAETADGGVRHYFSLCIFALWAALAATVR